MASRSLDELHPIMKGLVLKWVDASKKARIPFLIYCTHRDLEEQAELYSHGRSIAEVEGARVWLKDAGLVECAAAFHRVTGKPERAALTNAKPGFSFHHGFAVDGRRGGLAVDFVPTIGGKPQWADDQLYGLLGALAEKEGLSWSGRWRIGGTKLKGEKCHVQWDKQGTLSMPSLAISQFKEKVA